MNDETQEQVAVRVITALIGNAAIDYGSGFTDKEYPEIVWAMCGPPDTNEIAVNVTLTDVWRRFRWVVARSRRADVIGHRRGTPILLSVPDAVHLHIVEQQPMLRRPISAIKTDPSRMTAEPRTRTGARATDPTAQKARCL